MISGSDGSDQEDISDERVLFECSEQSVCDDLAEPRRYKRDRRQYQEPRINLSRLSLLERQFTNSNNPS